MKTGEEALTDIYKIYEGKFDEIGEEKSEVDNTNLIKEETKAI